MTAKEDYAKFYDLDSSEEEEGEQEEQRVKLIKKKKVLARKNSDDSSDTDDEENAGEEGNSEDEKEDRVAELGPEIVAKLRDDSVDYARGELSSLNSTLIISSSSNLSIRRGQTLLRLKLRRGRHIRG